MQWLNKIVDDAIAQHPEGEIVTSSGVSPSGKYHLGTLREVLTAEVIMQALRARGRDSRHIHVVDDFDVFRKVPAGIPEDFKNYLGKPLYQVPAPDGSSGSYADFYLADLLTGAEKLRLEMEVMRSHEKYGQGFFTEAIEKTLTNLPAVRKILEDISGRKLDEQWSPIQIMEEGYLKTRPFVSIDTSAKTIRYLDSHGQEQVIGYQNGEVKLNWRIDWPARWWLLNVAVEPFGRDHATKGGSYDTGARIVRDVFGAPPPLPVPYHFINRVGETKKMSKSAGDTVTLAELLQLMPAEIVWYFLLRFPPEKQLFFDEGMGMVRLFDEFGALLSKPDKTEAEQQLLDMSLRGSTEQVISSIPFSHLVASYQAALKNPDKTLEIIKRTEHAETVEQQEDVIKKELVFIEHWLNTKAPEEIKFSLADNVDPAEFSDEQKNYLSRLADEIESAPDDADGEWFHKAIYKFKEEDELSPQQLFGPLYRALIGKEAGPRAGWFLSILPRDWLIKRLRFEA
ncbi:MAG: Lysine--tRNA ligase [Candidatus Saccharibacteria bacterium]|nr:Lysine--tRNA ligase [Candidatus Saccharibacteria bacterium]